MFVCMCVCVIIRRAKLLKFIDKDEYGGETRTNYWKQRGKGKLKILKHKTTSKCRLLMRQDKIYKVCLNHVIPGAAADPLANGAKAYMIVALDYADNAEGETHKFALKFERQHFADEWKEAWMKARDGNAALPSSNGTAAPTAASATASTTAPAAAGGEEAAPTETATSATADTAGGFAFASGGAPLFGSAAQADGGTSTWGGGAASWGGFGGEAAKPAEEEAAAVSASPPKAKEADFVDSSKLSLDPLHPSLKQIEKIETGEEDEEVVFEA